MQSPPLPFRWMSVAGCAALVALALLAADGQAGGTRKKSASPEAEQLRNAWIYLAMANHDYDGQRVKAMHQIHDAVRLLDSSLSKTTSSGDHVLAEKEEVNAARVKFLEKHGSKVKEPQAISDMQLREAATILAGVQGALEKSNQKKALHHVREAEKHLKTALKVR